jgi:hypothetical protein
MKPSSSCPLGRSVKRTLEFSHFIYGVVGPCGHALALTSLRTRSESKGPSFPSGCVVLKIKSTMALSDSLPGTLELRLLLISRVCFPLWATPGEGLPSSILHFPLIPLPLTPGDSLALLQVLHAFLGLRLVLPGSASPCSHFHGGSYEAAGFTLCYGLKGCSSSSDFVTSLRCQNFA